MKKVLAATVLLTALAFTGATGREPSERVVAHEWGTFTSVALDTGAPARWAPWDGPPDLPCFVYQNKTLYKWSLSGTVRMETPVIYFYSDQAVTLDVKVRFPKGMISEWYPAAENKFKATGDTKVMVPTTAENGEIRWNDVKVQPGADVKLPGGEGASHYYAARATDAAPLRVGKESEKLLFYRGVGNFIPPLAVHYPGDGKLEIRNTYDETIPLAIAFENQGSGKTGYRVIRNLTGEVSIKPLQMTQDVAALHTELARELVEAGLYPKEAAAMVETWRDSWFEQGTRVFYIMPQAAVDRVLPLEIKPAAAEVKRVFVGRVEVLSPWIRQTIAQANAEGDVTMLKKFGRFLGPFSEQMKIFGSPAVTSARVDLAWEGQPGCVK